MQHRRYLIRLVSVPKITSFRNKTLAVKKNPSSDTVVFFFIKRVTQRFEELVDKQGVIYSPPFGKRERERG